ncbi:MAG: hypothetical protein P4L51_12520 [Puia sp.]|nr:hypothetical protein [Puia sp.]
MSRRILIVPVLFTALLLLSFASIGQPRSFSTRYATIRVSAGGYITSIRDRITGKEYAAAGDSSALLSLTKGKVTLRPVSASFDPARQTMALVYPNGSVARVAIRNKHSYWRMQLLSLSPRDGVDNIVWGPYKTCISRTIGEIVSVVRDDQFSIGLQALDGSTTGGPPSEGDLYQSYYLVHAPPGVTLPANLHEGQIFHIGGDSLGSSDVAFFSQPEEYFRYILGNGAYLTSYGSDIVLHARDRRIPQLINFKPSIVSPDRHQYVAPIDVDFAGSSVAFFGCPEPSTLPVISEIEVNEGLPHPMIDGKWVKDPGAAKPFLAWNGVHDSAISYARQLGFEAIQDEGLGEYYYHPGDPWNKKRVGFSTGSMSIPAYTALTNKAGIAFGLHTLCEFIQTDSRELTPVPNDHLCRVGSTTLTKSIGPEDTVIEVADPFFLRESGGWEDIYTNVLKIGHELISYDGISDRAPYTLVHPQRGWDHTQAGIHAAADSVHKLMPNAYRGFAPDIYLQDQYARAYADILNKGGMDYIDFDGLESCWYQGHGQYSIKRFYDTLFAHLHHYIRNTGSCIFEGNWHYMSSLDVGGDLFDPAANRFKIQGKDFKHIYYSNLLHFSFGLVNFSPRWDAAAAENLETRAIGWDGQYMLGLGQEDVEKCGEKQAIFHAIRTWEDARAAGVFTARYKEAFRNLENRFHLERVGEKRWKLYPVRQIDTTIDTGNSGMLWIQNPYPAQAAEFFIEAPAAGGAAVDGLTLQINGGKPIVFGRSLLPGQFVIGRGKRVYMADENRKEIAGTAQDLHWELLPGRNDVRVNGAASGGAKTTLKISFRVRGLPGELGTTK